MIVFTVFDETTDSIGLRSKKPVAASKPPDLDTGCATPAVLVVRHIIQCSCRGVGASPHGIVYAITVLPLGWATTDCSIDSPMADGADAESEMPDVCDRVDNCKADPEFNTAKPLIVAQHIININTLPDTATLFFDTVSNRRECHD